MISNGHKRSTSSLPFCLENSLMFYHGADQDAIPFVSVLQKADEKLTTETARSAGNA